MRPVLPVLLAVVGCGTPPPTVPSAARPAGQAPAPERAVAQVFASPGLGRSIADRVDADGDGHGDLLVADDAGWRLYLGGAGGLAATPAAQGPVPVDTLAGLGEVRGDGTRELAVSVPDPSGDGTGAVSLDAFGSGDGFAAPIQQTTGGYYDGGSSYYDPLINGELVGADLDRDGHGDLLWGHPSRFGWEGYRAGCVYLWRGSATGLARHSVQCRSAQGVDFHGTYTVTTGVGKVLSGPGDVDADGWPDVVTTSPLCGTVGWSTTPVVSSVIRLDARGSASGPALRKAQELEGVGTADDPTCFGGDAALVPDATDDGFDDVLVVGKNGASFLPGSSTGMDARFLARRAAPCPKGECRVAGTGDMDGDGVGDVALGSTGGVDVYAGGVLRIGATPMWHVALTAGVAHQVAPLGDVDGDGLDDLAISVPGTVAILLGTSTDDHDGDGTPDVDDCMPWDGAGSTGPEVPGNAEDEDCDGQVACFVDVDGDGWGAAVVLVSTDARACLASGLSRLGGDCADDDTSRWPGAPEVARDGIDQSCDGLETCWKDADLDGWGGTATASSADLACAAIGVSARDGDCDETRATVYPGATEVVGDQLDEDCDGSELCTVDLDGDEFGDFTKPPVLVAAGCAGATVARRSEPDCNDTNKLVNPDAKEVCTPPGVDDDCDGLVDDADPTLASLWYQDVDGDHYGVTSTERRTCAPPPPTWTAPQGGDCDDARADVRPFGQEVCDAANADEDCDGTADDADPSVTGQTSWYQDVDRDGYGSSWWTYCDPDTTLYSRRGDDCDDALATVHPGALDVPCDGVDEDCVGGDALDAQGCVPLPVDSDTGAGDTLPADSDSDGAAEADTDLPVDTEAAPVDTDTDAAPVDTDTDVPPADPEPDTVVADTDPDQLPGGDADSGGPEPTACSGAPGGCATGGTSLGRLAALWIALAALRRRRRSAGSHVGRPEEDHPSRGPVVTSASAR